MVAWGFLLLCPMFLGMVPYVVLQYVGIMSGGMGETCMLAHMVSWYVLYVLWFSGSRFQRIL